VEKQLVSLEGLAAGFWILVGAEIPLQRGCWMLRGWEGGGTKALKCFDAPSPLRQLDPEFHGWFLLGRQNKIRPYSIEAAALDNEEPACTVIEFLGSILVIRLP
jgi:hypothetical protein